MTEHRAEYITPGDGNELHGVTIEYKVLLKPGDRTEQRVWYGDVLAGDATKALIFALGMFNVHHADELKVWDITAKVNLAGDVLRQKLEAMTDENAEFLESLKRDYPLLAGSDGGPGSDGR